MSNFNLCVTSGFRIGELSNENLKFYAENGETEEIKNSCRDLLAIKAAKFVVPDDFSQNWAGEIDFNLYITCRVKGSWSKVLFLELSNEELIKFLKGGYPTLDEIRTIVRIIELRTLKK